MQKKKTRDDLWGYHKWVTMGINLLGKNSDKYNRDHDPPIKSQYSTENTMCMALSQY